MYQIFTKQLAPGGESLKHNAGSVYHYHDGTFQIGFETNGAAETFSIGQPIFDPEGHMLGYLGIGIYDNLNYADRVKDLQGNDIECPVERWVIENPTKYCEHGVPVRTYWQYINGM